jgi:xanthine dehydrogenase molybdopterin-binding subunit B
MQHLRILGERDQQVLTYIDCAHCSTAMVSILSISPQGMTAQGVITDLTPEEVVDSEDLKPVSSDDVLLIHQYLDNGGQPLFPRKTL